MSRISLDPTGTGAAWTFSFDGKPPKGDLLSRNVVAWAVRVPDRERVRLATGSELNKLPGRVRFFVGDATPDGKATFREGASARWGDFHWYEGNKTSGDSPRFPENYEVDMYVSQDLFNRLESLAAAQTIPKLTVSLGSGTDKDSIKYGWEPDGSGLEWDNIKQPHLEVHWCNFDVHVGLPASEEDDRLPDQCLAPPTKGDLAEAVTKATLKINQIGMKLLTALWLIAALLAWLAFRR
jgi:hypothetical protein